MLTLGNIQRTCIHIGPTFLKKQQHPQVPACHLVSGKCHFMQTMMVPCLHPSAGPKPNTDAALHSEPQQLDLHNALEFMRHFPKVFTFILFSQHPCEVGRTDIIFLILQLKNLRLRWSFLPLVMMLLSLRSDAGTQPPFPQRVCSAGSQTSNDSLPSLSDKTRPASGRAEELSYS